MNAHIQAAAAWLKPRLPATVRQLQHDRQSTGYSLLDLLSAGEALRIIPERRGNTVLWSLPAVQTLPQAQERPGMTAAVAAAAVSTTSPHESGYAMLERVVAERNRAILAECNRGIAKDPTEGTLQRNEDDRDMDPGMALMARIVAERNRVSMLYRR